MVPYIVFDIAGYLSGALTPFGAIGDALGNMIFTTCCYIGYKGERGEGEGEGEGDKKEK